MKNGFVSILFLVVLGATLCNSGSDFNNWGYNNQKPNYNRNQNQNQNRGPYNNNYYNNGNRNGNNNNNQFNNNRGGRGGHWSTGKTFPKYNNNNNNNFNNQGQRPSPSFNQFQNQGGFPDYEYSGLSLINQYRARHQAQGMSLDQSLVQRAQFCAQYYATMGSINHSCQQKSGAGENLYMVFGTRKNSVRASDATRRAIDSWYSENRKYKDYGQHFGMDSGTGHFTQLVWRGSQRLGVGVATVGGKTCVVTLFYPPGNYVGRFQNNVLPPTGK